MRTLNLAFLAILVVGLALAGGALHLAHGVQMRRNAATLLERARRAEAEARWAEAERALAWYVSLRPEDARTWAWYARLLDRQDADRSRVRKTYLVHQEALRRDPTDRELKQRAVALAMELGQHVEAETMLEDLILGAPPATTDAERAELEDLMGQCELSLGHHRKAAARFAEAVRKDPGRVDTYDRLARLRRTELREDEAAEAAIREMVDRNPGSGRAYAYRWRYRHELAPPADAADAARALELAPEDREVLLTGVMAAEQKRDAAALRACLEKGNRLDPKDIRFAIGLSRLESREGHPDRAEAVLRRSFEARPVIPLAFELADTLILQGKIEGRDGAGEIIAKLRRAGLGDTIVRFLDAEVLLRRKMWAEAAAELETARSILASEPPLAMRIDLMLAECHGRLGEDDKRLEDLRRASQGKAGGDVARMEIVRDLARSGRLDQAIATLSPMAIGGNNADWRLDLVRLLLQKAVRQPRGRRDWPEVERRLAEVEKSTTPESEGPVLLLRLDVLAAQDRLDEARALLSAAIARKPGDLGYRLAMARLLKAQGRADEALKVIDQAEKDLKPGVRIDLARLDYWVGRGGNAGREAMAKLAARRGQVPEADRAALLDRLGAAAIRLARPDLARQYWHELADLQAENLAVRLGLFDLALQAGDREEPARLVEQLRKIEGDRGINWRFARAALLLDQARRGSTQGLDEARRLAARLTEDHPGSWVGPTLAGQIAELSGSADQAISYYQKALELGNVQPSFARRLVRLLDQQGRRGDVEHVTQVLRDQGAALAEVTVVQALDAIRRRDYDLAISLARQIYPEASRYAADHLNLGRIYLAAGRSNEAGAEFRRAVELGPGVPENWLALVQFLAQAKRLDQARTAMEAARKALPPDRALLTMAQCALAIGDAREAEALIRRAMEARGDADDLAALRIAVEVYLRLGRGDEARKYLDRIAASPSATAGDQAWANRTLATLLLATNRAADHDRALTLVDRNLGESPDSAEDLALKATILTLRADRRPEAIAILEGLSGANRLDDDQRFLLARLQLGRGEVARYEGEMTRLLDRKEKDPRHLAHFINHWIDRKQLDQADRWLAELKQADPRGLATLEPEARLLDAKKRRPELLALLEARGREAPDQVGVVADLLNRYGFVREAEAAYRAFIARDPKQPERVLALAQFLARHDRPAEAIEILKSAWASCPPDRVALAAMAVFDAPSASAEQRRQVEAWAAEAARKQPETVELRLRLGLVWMWQRRFDDAARCFQQILDQSPDHPEALNSLAWLLAMRDAAQAPEALKLIEHAIEVAGPSPSLVDTRAVVLIRSGQIDKALKDIERARAIDARNPNFALHLAWAYQEEGHTDEARKAFRQAQDLGWTIAKCDPLERSLVDHWGRDLNR